MSSTKQQITRDQTIGGVDSTSPPFLVDESRWITSHNVRSTNGNVEVIPRKVIYGRLPNKGEPVLALVNLPSKKGFSTLLALTPSQALQIQANASTSSVLQMGTQQTYFNTDGNYYRWATVIYNKQLWFTNPLNPLMYTNGSRVGRYAGQLPAARYITEFFDHIVVADPTYKGKRYPTKVMWSHLYGPNQWEPKPENEADSFDVESWCRTDFPLYGVTGLGRIGDELAVFTPSCILKARYTGRPKVMYFGDPIEDVGCTLYYGLASYRSSFFFFDGISNDFFVYSAEGLQSIGAPIIRYFLNNLSTNYELAQRTWSFVRPETQEVGWVFCDTTSKGNFNKAVIFNWRSKAWYSASVENVHCIGGFCARAKTIDELAGTCDGLTFRIEDLANTSEVFPKLWGAADGYLHKEAVDADDSANLLVQDTPTIESKDRYYENLEIVKESDSVCIHAAYTGPSDAGVKTEISARSYIDDAVAYVTAGTWTPLVPEGRLSLPRTAGRLFRWRFSFVDATSGTVPETTYIIEATTNKEFGTNFKGQPLTNGSTELVLIEGGL